MFCGMSFTSSTRCSERYSDRRATSSSPGRGPSRTRAAGLFETLGRRDEFQKIEMESANRFHQDALALCKTYNVQSERALALMFDIRVQNGSISDVVRAQIEQDFALLGAEGDRDAQEVARLRIIANRRAEAANPQWVEDVRARKLTIANGEGTVHGVNGRPSRAIRGYPYGACVAT